jgi:hypothetical protein
MLFLALHGLFQVWWRRSIQVAIRQGVAALPALQRTRQQATAGPQHLDRPTRRGEVSDMATVMHIDKRVLFFSGWMLTHCGARLRPDEGAAKNAPLCPACMRAAGWTHNTRTM